MTATVLIAEDSAFFSLMYEAIFEPLDCNVIFADTAAKAVHIAAEEHPSLIIMDVHLADGTGDKATRDIRKLPEHGQTPIIVVSTAAVRDEVMLRDAGATAVMNKPIKIDRFTALVRQYLN